MPQKPSPRLYKRPQTAKNLQWWWNCIPGPERQIMSFMLEVPPPGPPATFRDAGILIMRLAYPEDFEERIDTLLSVWQISEQTIITPDGTEIGLWVGLSPDWVQWYLYEQLNPGWRFWSCIWNDFQEDSP